MVTADPDARKRFDALMAGPSPARREDLADLFGSLGAVTVPAMIGRWTGAPFPTGDPWAFLLRQRAVARWQGKDFRSADRVHALMVSVFGLTFAAPLGAAVLRADTFRGKPSTAMIYRWLPIVDHFRAVDPDTLMGAMEIRGRIRTWFGLRRETG